MNIFYWSAGIFLALVWISRLISAAIGVPKMADLNDPQWDSVSDAKLPHVSIIVPALNEQESVEAGLSSLLLLEYPNYEVIAVDDRSTDETGEIMDRLTEQSGGRLKVLHVTTLPTGWLGKPHAMWRAAQEATGDWLLFTDADVVFHPESVRRAVAYAETSRCDHLVLFPTMIMHGVGERMMIAFFQCMFVLGYRAWKAPDPKSREHLGVGAFNMVRRGAYETLGTFAALRMEVIEDMKLGKLVKEHGFIQRAAFGPELLRIHWAVGAMGIVRNLTKNFFAFMHFQWWRALLAALGLGLITLGPYLGVLVAPGRSKVGYAAALLAIFCVYVGMSTKSAISPAYFLVHPLAGVLFIYTILRSTAVTLWQGGITWRGTKYPLEELRKGLV